MRPPSLRTAFALLAVTAASAPTVAAAEGAIAPEEDGRSTASAAAPPPSPELGGATASPSPSGPERAPRPWLYLDDPSIPAPLHVIATLRGTYMAANSPSRPLGGGIGGQGAAGEVGAELGVLGWMSLAATGLLGNASGTSVGATAGLRFAPFRKLWRDTALVFSSGYVRELAGGNGLWVQATASHDFGPLRVGGTLHGEHIFQADRDGVDLMAMAGVTYRVLAPWRLGIEYVGQDLEGIVNPEEADNGFRQVLGPMTQVEVMDRRLSLVGGVAFGLTSASPAVTGRVGMAYAY